VDDQETDGGIVYKQTLRSVKLATGKKSKKTELTGKGPLRGEGPHMTVVPPKKKNLTFTAWVKSNLI
jgi:hypothetical protein